MVRAVSNALGLPIVMFSSAHHYPVVYTIPRICNASVPLFVAFNQADAGHYDAVTLKSVPDTGTNIATQSSHRSTQEVDHNRCTCGQKGKHYSTVKRCIPVQKKYTSIILCPCLAANRPCSSSCICNSCNNPNGIRPCTSTSIARPRQRQRHAWQQAVQKSSLFALKLQESVTKGPRTQLEYLLISEIVKYCHQKGIDFDTDIIQAIYTSCVELAHTFELSLPLGSKGEHEINVVLLEYDSNKAMFEAMCVTQLKINSSSLTTSSD